MGADHGFMVIASETGPRGRFGIPVFAFAMQTIGQRKFGDGPQLLRKWYAIRDKLPKGISTLKATCVDGIHSETLPGTVVSFARVISGASRTLAQTEATSPPPPI